MTLAFILTMPGRSSWNGRWSGDEKVFAAFRNFSTQKATAKATELIGYYSYGWSDGWRAGIQVKPVEGAELRKLRKTSQGFCGYDWMIDSIIQHKAIYANDKERLAGEARKEAARQQQPAPEAMP